MPIHSAAAESIGGPEQCQRRTEAADRSQPNRGATSLASASSRAARSETNGPGPSTFAPVISETQRALVATVGSSSAEVRLSTTAARRSPRCSSASTLRAQWFSVPSPARPTSTTGSRRDRKSTRLNSSHGYISYAVFCLKKKKKNKKERA